MICYFFQKNFYYKFHLLCLIFILWIKIHITMINAILRRQMKTKPIFTLSKEMKNIKNFEIIRIGEYNTPRCLQAIKVLRNLEISQNFDKFQPFLNKKSIQRLDIFE